MTRVAAHRILELLDHADSLGAKVALANAIGLAAMRVASLLRTKKHLAGDQLDKDLAQALQELAQEQELAK